MEAKSGILVTAKSLAVRLCSELEKNHDNLTKFLEKEFDYDETEAQEALRWVCENMEKASEVLSVLNDTANSLAKIVSEKAEIFRIEENQN